MHRVMALSHRCVRLYMYLLCASDTLSITYLGPNGPNPVGLINTNIAWTTDKSSKFHNPKGADPNNLQAGQCGRFVCQIIQ